MRTVTVQPEPFPSTLLARQPGFSLHAATVCEAAQHNKLEKPDKPLAPMTWMQRLKRVFAIDIETHPKCGGKLRVIACIENPDVIATILEHIRVREAATTANPRAPRRAIPRQAAVENDRLTPCRDRYPSNRRFARPFRLQRPPAHPQLAQRTPLKTSPERPVNQPDFATIPFRAVIRPIRIALSL